MDEFDFVAVWVFHKGNHGGAVFHRASFAHDIAAFGAGRITGGIRVFYFDGDVAIGIAQVVAAGVPIVGEFQNGVVDFIAIADKGQGEFDYRVDALAQ